MTKSVSFNCFHPPADYFTNNELSSVLRKQDREETLPGVGGRGWRLGNGPRSLCLNLRLAFSVPTGIDDICACTIQYLQVTLGMTVLSAGIARRICIAGGSGIINS